MKGILNLDQEKTERILTFAGVFFASLWLILSGILAGNNITWQSSNAFMPYYVSALSDGMYQMARYHFAIAAAILGISISVPLDEFAAGIKKSAKVALYASSVPIISVLWTFLLLPTHVTGSVDASSLSLLLLPISIFAGLFYAVKIWAALAAATMLVQIIVQTLLKFLISLNEENDDESMVALESEQIAITGCIAAAAVFFLGVIPGFGSQGIRETDSPQAVWEKLEYFENQKPWIEDTSKVQRVKRHIKVIEAAYYDTQKKPCDPQNFRTLQGHLDAYFKDIRIIENWTPGTELSPLSKTALNFAKRALENQMLDWSRLNRAVRIHLDEKELGNARHRFPNHCADG